MEPSHQGHDMTDQFVTTNTLFVDKADVAARALVFRETLEAYYAAEHAKQGFDVYVTRFALEAGKRYIKVVQSEDWPNGANTGRSVYCFIDASNGDLLKAAGWKAPAKGKRGSIFNDNCDVGTVANMHGSGLYSR
jgi:hypothetical protein